MDQLEKVQRRAMKIVRGLEHLSDKERLRQLRMKAVQPREKKASGRPYCLSTFNGAL